MSKNQTTTVRSPEFVGETIRNWRKAKGLTQEELSRKTRVSQRAISMIENGSKTAELKTIFAIFAALDLEMVIQPRSASSKEWSPKEIFG